MRRTRPGEGFSQAVRRLSAGSQDPWAFVERHVAIALSAPQRVRLSREGRRVPVADTWIAAAAAVRDDYVVSSNKRDFTRLGVEAWHYEDEPGPPR